jgi:hypothetical protein
MSDKDQSGQDISNDQNGSTSQGSSESPESTSERDRNMPVGNAIYGLNEWDAY